MDWYVMKWAIPASTLYSLKVTGGTPFKTDGGEVKPLSPPPYDPKKPDNPTKRQLCWINSGSEYGYVVFETLKVEIYPADKYGNVIGDKPVDSTTIKIIPDKETKHKPKDDKEILKFTLTKHEEKKDPWDSRYSYAVEAPKLPIPRETPPIISNKWWLNGQDDIISIVPTVGKKYWVADYGADQWSPDTPGTWWAIQQSTEGSPPKNPKYFGSRAYPILIETGENEWKVTGGNGVAFQGCWQIAIEIGSGGKGPWCETFYLAERVLDDRDRKKQHDLVWGPEYYSDGQGGIGGGEKEEDEERRVKELIAKKVPVYPHRGSTKGGPYGLRKDHKIDDLPKGSGAYSREIDIMETRWTPLGPQINILNIGGGTAWNDDPDYGLPCPPVPKAHVKTIRKV